MSHNRLNPKRGYCDQSRLPRGPNGRALCRECQTEVPKGRLTFCSEKCVESWKLRSQPGYVRHKLFERDHGICAKCHIDTVVLVENLRELDRAAQDRWARGWMEREVLGHQPELQERLRAKLKELCIPPHRYFNRRGQGVWDADHIKAVSEGGGECGLDNYRTLCLKCHKGETTKLAGRRAHRRKSA